MNIVLGSHFGVEDESDNYDHVKVYIQFIHVHNLWWSILTTSEPSMTNRHPGVRASIQGF